MAGFAGVMLSHKLVVSTTPVPVLYFDLSNSSSWPGSGTSITDLSGNGHTGTLLNSPTYTSTSITTASNGSTPKCITTSYNLPASNWSVRLVMNMSSTQTYWATHWGNEAYTNAQGFFAYSSNTGYIWSGSISYGAMYTGSFQGTSRQYDYTFDGTYHKIYINGSLMATSSTSVAPTVATDGLYFGSRHSNSGGNTQTDGNNATYYMMQVYTSALTSTQISAAYTANKSKYGI